MTQTPLQGWHHTPDVPLHISPLFRWPLQPLEVLRWFWDSWFLMSERLILVAVAFISWTWLQPPLEVMQTLRPGPIAGMFARNLVLMTLVAGSLHL